MVLQAIQVIFSIGMDHLNYFSDSQLICTLMVYDFCINKDKLSMQVTILFINQKHNVFPLCF